MEWILIVTKRMSEICKYKSFVPPNIWALQNYILEKESAVGGGRFNFKYAPHLELPLKMIGDDDISSISLFFASQSGKTTIAMVCINWAMDLIGGNIMFFIPDEALVSFTTTDRILPSINRTCNKYSIIQEKEDRNLRDNTKNIRYMGGVLRVLAATKSTNRKSTPAKIIFLDEISEMKPKDVAEISERAKTFEKFGSKIIKTSTIMYENDPIDLAYKTSEKRFEYFVKCPYCNEEHIDDFLANIVIPPKENYSFEENLSEEEKNIRYAQLASRESYYKCPKCEAKWSEKDKEKAVRNGGWKITYELENAKSVGFKASSFISLLVSVEKMVYEYLECFADIKQKDERLTTFYRGWLSRIYKPEIITTRAEDVLECRSDLEKGQVPNETLGIFMAIDVQKDHYYYTFIAFDYDYNLYIIDWGKVLSERALESLIFESKFISPSGMEYFCESGAMDSGYNAHFVYSFCNDVLNKLRDYEDSYIRDFYTARNGLAFSFLPVKGSSNSTNEGMKTNFNTFKPEKNSFGKAYEDSLMLNVINTYNYKDELFGYIQNALDDNKGKRIFLPKNATKDIADSLTSERKIEVENKKHRKLYTYEPYTEKPFNHYLDCIVYCLHLADIAEIRFRKNKILMTKKYEEQKALQERSIRKAKMVADRPSYLDEF